MKAATIQSHGSTDEISIQDVPAPAPSDDEVLLEVEAAAVNHLDLFVCQGMPGLSLEFPHILGSDAVGTVVDQGENVDRWSEGDRVVINPGLSCGTCRHCQGGEHSLCESFHLIGEHRDGTFAERVTVPEQNCEKVPAFLEPEEAASFSLVFVTAWRMLMTRGDLQPGETVLIHGIGGGVSQAALKIASSMSCECIVTSSSEEKLRKARDLGASRMIQYTTEDVAERVEDFTEGRGVDLVVENVGKATWNTSQKCVRKGGRIVTCGATTGFDPATNINRIFWKQINILGSTMGSHSDYRGVLDWMNVSRRTPEIDRVYSLEEVSEAEKRLEAGDQFGKIVIDIEMGG